MKKRVVAGLTLCVVISLFLGQQAKADVTSPRINDKGRTYTKEKPNHAQYGNGNSARLTEASELRMVVDELVATGEWEQALPKALKAVQLDPADPSGHLFLAKILTNKFYTAKGKIDEKLLGDALREWQMIRYHDADPTEQWEAGQQAKKLIKISKALEKDKMRRARDKERAEAIAEKEDAKGVRVSESVEGTVKTDSESDSEEDESPAPRQVAKKRFFGLL